MGTLMLHNDPIIISTSRTCFFMHIHKENLRDVYPIILRLSSNTICASMYKRAKVYQ